MPENKQKAGSFPKIKATVKYLFPMAWKQRKSFFFLFAVRTLLNAALPFIGIMLMPMIIDELLGGRDIRLLLMYAAVLVVGEAAVNMVISCINMELEKDRERFDVYFTEEMSRRVMELDFQLTEDKDALDQIEAARTGMTWYSEGIYGVATQLFNIIGAGLKIIGTVTLIAVNAPLMFPIIAAILIFDSIIRAKGNKIDIEAFAELSKGNRIFGYTSFQLTELRYGKDIRLYEARDMMIGRWNEVTEKEMATNGKATRKRIPLGVLSSVLSALRDGASYLYLGILVIGGKITIGVFSQMLSSGNTFHQACRDIMWGFQEIAKRCNYAYEYVKFMDYPAAIEKGSRHVENKPHTIEFRNVEFAYPHTDVKVLKGISLTLKQGEHLSVVGLNGAGKTTFVKLLCRLYDPTGGEILLDGVNIKEYDYEEYMALFSPVFQDFKLFAFNIRENIVLDDKDGDASAYIEKTGLKEKVDSYEKGDGTMLFKAFDENGVEPSGGEQQKIAIARALYKNSPVVILDEPTAALDPVAEYDIYRQFSDLVGGKTAIYISHRLSSCKFCDRIAVFSEGVIKEYGTHDELAELPKGIYAEMFAAQAQYYQPTT